MQTLVVLLPNVIAPIPDGDVEAVTEWVPAFSPKITPVGALPKVRTKAEVLMVKVPVV